MVELCIEETFEKTQWRKVMSCNAVLPLELNVLQCMTMAELCAEETFESTQWRKFTSCDASITFQLNLLQFIAMAMRHLKKYSGEKSLLALKSAETELIHFAM